MDPEHTVLMSAVSLWEIGMQESIGEVKLPGSFGAETAYGRWEAGRLWRLGSEGLMENQSTTLERMSRQPSMEELLGCWKPWLAPSMRCESMLRPWESSLASM